MLKQVQAFGAINIASLLLQLGSSLLMTYLALSLSSDGLSDVWGGALMAANALGMVTGGQFGHKVIAGVGHVRTYVACAGIICAAVLAHAFSDSMLFWLLLRFVVGMSMMCQLTVIESWLNDRAQSHERGVVLGNYMIASYVGMMLGQLTLSLKGDLGIHALLIVAITFALSQVPVALTRSAHPTILQPGQVSVRRFVRRIPQSLVTVLVSGIINGSFYGLAAIYAKQQGLDTAGIGKFMALTIGAGLLAQLPLGWVSDRFPRASIIRLAALLLMLACLPLGLIQGLQLELLMLCTAIVGFFQFCLYPLGVALANDNVEPEMRIPLAGLLLGTFGIGACMGPLIAGGLMSYYGPPSLYYFLASCAAILVLIVGQKKVSGKYLQQDAPLLHQATPSGLATANIAATEPVESVNDDQKSQETPVVIERLPG
ncbi:MFS transporter [Pseudomonas sp. JZ134]|uniref:MFS transporter n=1 Tax=Pseudomonas sp. JZ134 TaxID=2806615 RepID=UPI003D9FCDB2